jgi:hypothetical protein
MIDHSRFDLLNVTDTCSIWNVLASRALLTAAQSARVSFCLTKFVQYECLHKPGHIRPERIELQRRLRHEVQSGRVVACSIDLEDLQDVDALEKRKSVSKGELSSMVFARKTKQAFMTDDGKAAKLARTMMPVEKVQTTSHLLGWLYFTGRLLDRDKETILAELVQLNRNLRNQVEAAYTEALRCRLIAQATPNPNSG